MQWEARRYGRAIQWLSGDEKDREEISEQCGDILSPLRLPPGTPEFARSFVGLYDRRACTLLEAARP